MKFTLTPEEWTAMALEGLRKTVNRLRGCESWMREIARTGPAGDINLTLQRLEPLARESKFIAELLEDHRELRESADLALALYRQVRAEHHKTAAQVAVG
jgi:hypothetical protein